MNRPEKTSETRALSTKGFLVSFEGFSNPILFKLLAFSAHINSVDLPDLTEFRETARETRDKVETAIGRERSATNPAPRSSVSVTQSLGGPGSSPRPKSEAVSIGGPGGGLIRSHSNLQK